MMNNDSKSKIIENKAEKEHRLLDSAYKLFTEKGINNTSIQDIVNEAKVAKGTFYLYFEDKYKLQEKLIIKKSSKLFNNAINHLNECKSDYFEDKIIFIIDHVINQLVKEPLLIRFIYKDLSLGYYTDKISTFIENNEIGLYDMFIKGIKENNIKLENPDVTLFMIIELVSSTCYTSITKKQPLPINEFKPILYSTIKTIINAK